jgi:plastocyanin
MSLHCLTRQPFRHKSHLRRVFPALLSCARPKALVCLLALGLTLVSTMRGMDSAPQESLPAETSKAEVRIDNFSFSPKEITVAVGTTVTWTNHDDVPHVVASADDQFRKSPALDTDESFSHTFSTAGSYTYFCSIHPHMTGKIIVK